MMRATILIIFTLLGGWAHADAPEPATRGDLILIQGSPGESQYAEIFSRWSERWKKAAERGQLKVTFISPESAGDRQKEQFIAELAAQRPASSLPLWVVMVGHGTFDGRAAKFNLAGPDLSARELNEALAEVTRLSIVVNCSSSSAPFIEELSQENRILVTSTRSGEQINFSRFGEFFSEAIGSLDADLDKDRQTSLLEAFLSASRQTTEYYEAEGRIPTENALIDDNGDGSGTRANAFEGVRATATPEKPGVFLDGFRAHQIHLVAGAEILQLSAEQLAARNELEKQIELLRLRKKELPEEEYYQRLEVLFLQLAELLLEPDSQTESAPPMMKKTK